MNRKINNIIFFVLCITLIFNNTPSIIHVNALGNVIGDKFILYPLMIGFIYTLYMQYKYKSVFVDFQKIKLYILIYTCVNLVSFLGGLLGYPYYDIILNSPIDQIEKLVKIEALLSDFGFYIEERTLLLFWFIGRAFKNILFESLTAFFGAYMVYCWYRLNWKYGYKLLSNAILCSLIVILVYCFIEVGYLAGNQWAECILIYINPYFHAITSDGTWWPPLLLKGQVRSVFAEPSYFGIYAAFAMPLLWYQSYTSVGKKRGLILCALLIFTWLLFLTKARTAIALFLGELALLFVFMLYLQNKHLVKRFIMVVIVSVFSFAGAIGFLTVNNPQFGGTLSYMSDNVGSLSSSNQRSNQARYAIMQANVEIGLAHPILGVGPSLRQAYIPDYLSDAGKCDQEVKMWIRNQKEKGVLKSGFPNLGEYTTRFAETGIIGLLIFLIPAGVLLQKLFICIKHRKKTGDEVCPYVFISLSLIGLLTAGIGDSINVTYCYWVVLGLGYAMCFGKNDEAMTHE
jgi:hypothetical protein